MSTIERLAELAQRRGAGRQKPITPDVLPCWCGASARPIDWDFRDMWRVMCDKNHTLTKECGSVHRAVCLWNNRVAAQIAARTEQEGSNEKHY